MQACVPGMASWTSGRRNLRPKCRPAASLVPQRTTEPSRCSQSNFIERSRRARRGRTSGCDSISPGESSVRACTDLARDTSYPRQSPRHWNTTIPAPRMDNEGSCTGYVMASAATSVQLTVAIDEIVVPLRWHSELASEEFPPMVDVELRVAESPHQWSRLSLRATFECRRRQDTTTCRAPSTSPRMPTSSPLQPGSSCGRSILPWR